MLILSHLTDFFKQYLLLAGREEKYKKLYLKTVEDVRKWMLYRPMLPDDNDILFSGAVMTKGNPEEDLILTAEVEHLTCFIGGMIGMGAKIFGIESDLEIAKKLTDGCVWAYSSFETGIMPEGSRVVPCRNAENCAWNETAYYLHLDPMGEARDSLLKLYDENKLVMEAEAEAQAKLHGENSVAAKAETDAQPVLDEAADATLAFDPSNTEPMPSSEPISLPKRGLEKRQRTRTKSQAMRNAEKLTPFNFAKPYDRPPTEDNLKVLEQKSSSNQAQLETIAGSGRQAEIPLSEKNPISTLMKDPLKDLYRPLSHKQYVEARIKQASLPPGFVGVRARTYILRYVGLFTTTS